MVPNPMAHTFGSRSARPQSGRSVRRSVCAGAATSEARSAPASRSGSSHHTATQHNPALPSSRKAPRQPTAASMAVMTGGDTAAPSIAAAVYTPTPNTRWRGFSSNATTTGAAMKLPVSNRPRKKRLMASCGMLCTAALMQPAIDHAPTKNGIARTAPSRSISRPDVRLPAVYATMKQVTTSAYARSSMPSARCTGCASSARIWRSK